MVRINAVRRSLPHLSGSALASVMRYVKDHDVSDVPTSRSCYRKARDSSLPDTPYGPMVLEVPVHTHTAGETYNLSVLNPLSFLYQVYNVGGGFHHMLREAMNECSYDKPMRLVIYAHAYTHMCVGDASSLVSLTLWTA